MRTELERIQLIEKHLEGTLSSEEKVAFNEESRTNPNFKNEIETQKRVLEGVKRTAFKTKSMKKFKLFKRKQNLWKWGLGGALTVLVLSVATPLLVDMNNVNRFTTTEEELQNIAWEIQKTEETKKNFENLADQTFFINNMKDTVIETKEGLVFDIPKDAFVNEDGDVITEGVKLSVKEAVTTDQIISAGLTTTSNGKLLETGGMFHISATADGETLALKRNITVQVPQDDYKPGMMLFDGERDKDGNVNWVNPEQLESWLTPVEITILDFYPPGYEALLDRKGYGANSKAWKDSLYYSFAAERFKNSWDSINYRRDATEELMDSIKSEDELAINPAKIQTIWTKKFNNTNLATKEFQERLRYIFSICSHEALDLYVNNLDLNLWEVDEMATKIAGANADKFKEFAARKNGRIELDSKAADRLGKHYARKQQKFQKTAEDLQRKYQEEQLELVEEWNKVQKKQNNKEIKRKGENLAKEYVKNLTEVYKQLGREIYRGPTITATVWTLGAKNIDQYVMEATISRTSATFEENGKTAKMEYLPKYLKVDNKDTYERMYCYLLSEELYSFQRMDDTTRGFTYKLNGFLEYNIAVVAYKGDQVFLGTIKGVDKKLAEEPVELKELSKRRLKTQLDKLAGRKRKSFKQDIIEDLVFQKARAVQQQRVQDKFEMEHLREEVKEVIFPCADNKLYCGWMSESYDPRNTGKEFRLYLYHDATVAIYLKDEYHIEGKWHFKNDKSQIIICEGRNKWETFNLKWVNNEQFSFIINEKELFFQLQCNTYPAPLGPWPCEGEGDLEQCLDCELYD